MNESSGDPIKPATQYVSPLCVICQNKTKLLTVVMSIIDNPSNNANISNVFKLYSFWFVNHLFIKST